MFFRPGPDSFIFELLRRLLYSVCLSSIWGDTQIISNLDYWS